MTKTPWCITLALFGVFTGTAQAAPAVTGLAPQSGSAAGGTVVTISGTGLSTATTVKFGTTTGTILSKSSTQVVAVSPAKAAGGTSIRVTDSGGATSPDVANDNYTYNAVAAGTLWFAPAYNAATTTVSNSSATTAQWADEHEAADDRVQIVTGSSVPAGSNPSAKPYGALKVSNLTGDLTTLTGSSPHPRAEAFTQYRRWTAGETAWIDYWLFVPTSTSLINTASSSYSTIFQWKGNNGSPAVGLEIDPADEHLKITSNQFPINQSLGALTHNKWIRITVGVTFGTSSTTGRVMWSVDGAAVQTINKQTIGASGSGNDQLYPKQGLYQSYDDRLQPDRILYDSPIRIASTQALAQQR